MEINIDINKAEEFIRARVFMLLIHVAVSNKKTEGWKVSSGNGS